MGKREINVLKISVNDLLCGEIITMNDYNEKLEANLLELVRQKEETDKRLLSLEILIGVFSLIILFGFVFTAALVPMADWLRVCLIIVGFIVCMIGVIYALKIEQTAGYYECSKCHHRYIPTFSSVFWSAHINRTRYMRCPKCNKKSWNKKVLTKK